MKRQDLYKGCQICSDSELFASDSHGEVSAKRSPQLEADGVGCSAVKDSDTQSVFEPAKEQFDLPAVSIKLGYDGGADLQLIGPEGQTAGVLEVVNADATQKTGPMLRSSGAVKSLSE